MRALRWILLFLLLAPAASADWLVTREGAHVETKGPWKVKGRVVVFTLPNGTLSSMRLSEVDLDRSAEATAEADKPPEPEAEDTPPPREVVAELTNENIRRAAPPPGQAAATAADEGNPLAIATPPFEVLSWKVVERPDAEGVEVRGSLRNGGENLADKLSVMVRLVTPVDDGLIDERPAQIGTPTLRPQAATTFNALFPGIENQPFKLELVVTGGS